MDEGIGRAQGAKVRRGWWCVLVGLDESHLETLIIYELDSTKFTSQNDLCE